MAGTPDRDVVVVGGGHNGLVAAAYLARAGLAVTVLEAGPRVGGAVASAEVFDGVAVKLSRFSYLVSLLPQRIIDDLGLDLELRSRRVASYTPSGDGGLLVERLAGGATRASFADGPGLVAYEQLRDLEDELHRVASVVAPTLIQPLPRAGDLRAAVGDGLWSDLVERPIGQLIERRISDDTVRGIVLTDALIGTFASAWSAELQQNRCFLYHVIGNGTGEWKVPVGGMGTVAAALESAARSAGAELQTGVEVVSCEPGHDMVVVRSADGSVITAPTVLANCAPATLAGLLGTFAERPEGAQVKINLVLRRLPRFRSGIDPRTGFAGTLHLNQGYAQLERAYRQAAAGRVPEPLPCESYCHSLTDPSIVTPQLRSQGFHTLTIFGLHTPARLFDHDHDRIRARVRDAALSSLQSALAEPLEDCVARDVHGELCIEVMSPQDVERHARLPGGHICHGDLSWPWLADDERPDTPAQRWGVATEHPGILVCGSGARRGGAVSGLGGHNAAMAVLEDRGLPVS
ncbi:MAG TPA: NAD(P)/FAD-dependent oxidoreductase [Microlunatus sp.]|nr:NAD(P)/FAD-dependent oxidoreductase [Microlunatus sp.]